MGANEGKLPRVCVVTMVKDDYFFLSKWMRYYEAQVGRENLFVIAHGADPKVLEIAEGANITPIPCREEDTVGFNKFEIDRFALINGLCNGLVRYFDYVVLIDVDEFVVVDPELGQSLPQYLADHGGVDTISAFGLDIVHRTNDEPAGIDPAAPVLAQRRYCKVEPLYCKPVITRSPITRSLGNHASNDSRLYFGPGLYLFHMKWVDRALSMNMHFNRHISKNNLNYVRDLDLEDNGLDFPLRSKVDEIFASFNSLPVADKKFDFSSEKMGYERSWRRRRFVFQKSFWRSLFSKDGGHFSFHWRFDLLRYPEIHRIPDRFSTVL